MKQRNDVLIEFGKKRMQPSLPLDGASYSIGWVKTKDLHDAHGELPL